MALGFRRDDFAPPQTLQEAPICWQKACETVLMMNL
jgi:hypothetical protein